MYCLHYVPSVLWCCWLGGRKGIARKNLSDEVLALLSVWSEVQMTCIWSGWCHCHPIISASVKSRMAYPSGSGLPGSPGKKSVKRQCVCVCVCVVYITSFGWNVFLNSLFVLCYCYIIRWTGGMFLFSPFVYINCTTVHVTGISTKL